MNGKAFLNDSAGRSALLATIASAALAAPAAAQLPLSIVNAGFESGAPFQTPDGWAPVNNAFWIGASSMGGADPATGYLSPQFASASWQYAGLPNANSLVGGGAYQASMRQDVDLSPYAAEIVQGEMYLGLSYAYFHNDGTDIGRVTYEFLDANDSSIDVSYSAPTVVGGGWQFVQNLSAAAVPANAAKLRITLQAQRNGFTGTARNIAFDAISASLQPPPPPEPPSGIVHGNLIQFDSDGAWTWYSDERAVVDPNNGHILVNSVGFSPTVSGSPADVDVVDFNPLTGRRLRTQLSNLQPGNPPIQNDDHNNGALLVLPDGRYLALYSNHGNTGGLGDQWTRWRVSANPGDSTSWSNEQLFNWFHETPGVDPNGSPDAANVSYHNLFHLSAEDQVYNISRSFGQAPNILRYDPATNDLEWAGQLADSQTGGYSTGYFKYASNGVDRIYFTHTETHPRNYNTSIYAGYLENGQSFDMQGNLIDADVFDNETSAGGSGFVPDVTQFTVVHAADPLGEGHNRLWTVDANLDDQDNPMALYISRWNPDGSTSAGSTSNPIDHRLHFANWNPDAGQWQTYEVARMGNRLYRLPSDGSEQDYTGNAALVPGDPNAVYISTPYDPRDASGMTFTTSYEIYKGVTSDGGASWAWTAITENSVVDNLRPIVPDSYGGDTTVLWFRGTYSTAHSIDAAVVGIVERKGEVQSLVNYVDANAANTMYASGAPLQTSTPSSGPGALDNLWHQRTGVGNGGDVLASSEGVSENAPMLKTTVDGLQDGLYDVFAYFWSDNDEDWRLLAGLESDNLIDFRRYGSQHAAADQFVHIDAVSENSNDLLLYRAYLGRTEVLGGSEINVFVDDWQSNGDAIRTWFDGVGYSLVSGITPIAGDFDGNLVVDGLDLAKWKGDFGVDDGSDADGDGDSDGSDFLVWQRRLGVGVLADAAGNVPEPAGLALLLSGAACLSRRRSDEERRRQ